MLIDTPNINPAEIVSMAVTSCEQVRLSIESGAAPYDGEASRRWLSMLETP